MAGPKDKRKKKDKDYSKDQKNISKKYSKIIDNIKFLKKDYSDKPFKMGAQYAAGALTAIPMIIGELSEKGIRAAKKKITGKAKGGMIIAPKSGSAHYKSTQSAKSIAKKYFKGGMN